MRSVNPSRVWLTVDITEFSREQIQKEAILLYEIGQQHPIVITPQLKVIDGCLQVYAARKLRRGFFTFHRGLKPRLYRKRDFTLFASIHSDFLN